MALNVNALVNTSLYPLTANEVYERIKKDDSSGVGKTQATSHESLNALKKEKGHSCQHRYKKSEGKFDSKHWLKLLDIY